MKLSKLCLALGISTAVGLGGYTTALATDWVMKKPQGCNIQLVNKTHAIVTTSAYGGVTLAPVGHKGSTVVKRSLTGCSFGVPSPLGVTVYTKGLNVFTRYLHDTNTYLIKFSGDLGLGQPSKNFYGFGGNGVSYGECTVAGHGGNHVRTSNLHGTYCFSPPVGTFKHHRFGY